MLPVAQIIEQAKQYFQIYELVDPVTYAQFNEKAWWFICPCALLSLIALREQFGPITINDWYWGGNYKYSGYRPPNCTVGAKYSQHKFGRGFDAKSKAHTAIAMQDYILANPKQFPFITAMENAEHTKTWLHFDTRLSELLTIIVFDLRSS
ncbi:hypothetical protein tloyanaT_26060 [Thalassotalea loyana]|uniref:Peptidase M15A C-terminal domain-containing protein n=1 Tax=Thalassotalea loyana TaxID=280483 RepID=A0ABQ6HE44_9GAMM|nr:hypothetical protein [Thalassotalea loyana]GLX86353.1 hypothetical protein tloyanaT_26060 [Thalassotalea loyana]